MRETRVNCSMGGPGPLWVQVPDAAAQIAAVFGRHTESPATQTCAVLCHACMCCVLCMHVRADAWIIGGLIPTSPDSQGCPIWCRV